MGISTTRKVPTSAVFLCMALLILSATGVEKVGALCGKPSGTFRGPCLSSGNCNEQCRARENAIGGACYGFACYCHYGFGTEN